LATLGELRGGERRGRQREHAEVRQPQQVVEVDRRALEVQPGQLRERDERGEIEAGRDADRQRLRARGRRGLALDPGVRRRP
jgi:hypothetical protein